MRTFFGIVVAAVLASPAFSAEKECQLQRYAEMPITMVGMRPLVEGTINGSPTRFLFDSGAFFSIIPRAAADRLGLKVGSVPPQLQVRGVGGAVQVGQTRVKEFTLTGFAGGRVYSNVDFLVGGPSFGHDETGLIGQNIIGEADSEYDLANGFVRLFRTQGCRGRMLAYWSNGAPVAEIQIDPTTVVSPHLIGTAKLNGKRIRVLFDTGAWRSVLTLTAAKRLGIKPEDEGLTDAGISGGLGKRAVENWLARFDTLDIGGEVIKNAKLRIGDFSIGTADMLLGADFFLSHRIYVANKHRKMFFTYNGGPVFDLRPNITDPNAAPPTTLASTSQDQPPSAGADPSLDAAALRRRGAAAASRGALQSALADLDQAIALDASDVESFYQRGIARWRNQQPSLAMDDFDQALKLKPDHVSALLSRGALRLMQRDAAGATADFDVAAGLAPSDSAVNVQIAEAFQHAGQFEEAIRRLDAWIAANPKHDRLPSVLNERCWTRALQGKELELALADCNTAINRQRNSAVLDSRALVHLRRGDLDAAIADYKAALKLQPKQAGSLYGLGIAQLRKGLRTEAERDMQAALELSSNADESFKRVGLAP
jgi:tetratricopeptide (TPR) repeat protein/predicted aspartyl protease